MRAVVSTLLRQAMIELTPRNDTQLSARFGVLTIAIDHLSSAYVDMHHEALDSLQLQLAEIRAAALEASRSEWSDLDLCTIVANLIGIIEVAEDSEPDKDGVIETTAIAALRESEVFTSARDKAMPLANAMSGEGTQYLFVKLQRDLRLHHQAKDLWQLACIVELKGDLAAYFDEDVEWPPIKGNLNQRLEVIQQRSDIISELSSGDSGKLLEAFEKHIDHMRELNKAESKN